jgi:hypothetical protein
MKSGPPGFGYLRPLVFPSAAFRNAVTIRIMMNNKALLLSVILASFALSAIALREASAENPTTMPPQSDASLEVIATNGADEEKHLFSEDGRMPMLMVRPNQTVPVTLQFPTTAAGATVAATPLDGGRIEGHNLVLSTGTALFTFSPGAMPGRYRVLVNIPGQQYLLEFYVVDPNQASRQQRRGSSY